MTIKTRFYVTPIYQIYKDNEFGNAPVYMAQYPSDPNGLMKAQAHAKLLQDHNDEERKGKK